MLAQAQIALANSRTRTGAGLDGINARRSLFAGPGNP